MYTILRRNAILSEIERAGSVTVGELAKQTGVSEATIRRDLSELEKEGLIRRVHGGAVSQRGRGYEPPFLLRETSQTEAKKAIAARAAGLVLEGDTVALDTGTTTLEVARQLLGRRNLTVLTSSLYVANTLLAAQDIRLILTGGIVRPGEASLVGELGRRAWEGLFVDRLFLGVGCVDSRAGLSEYNWDDALMKQAMIQSAKQVILVADATKFQKVAFAGVAPLTAVDVLVTDREPPPALAEALKGAGVAILIGGQHSQE